MPMFTRKVKKGPVSWEKAPDVQKNIEYIVKTIGFVWGKEYKIIAFRSENSKTNAYARIWGLPKIWQMALETTPAYALEVISEKYDKLDEKHKTEVLIHELTHIPKNFSGSLVPHFRKGKRNFQRKVKDTISIYFQKKK